MLNKSQTEKYKEKLEKEKASLLGELKAGSSSTDFGGDIDGSDEETDETEEIGNRVGVDQVLRNRIVDIETTLEKIKKGTFGVCEHCHGDISNDVLDVIPSSRLCKNCKK